MFHSKEWLDALKRTYGFRAAVLTTSTPSERLTNGLAFCWVQGRMTVRRLISIPFSDHCMPLIDTEENYGHLISRLRQETDQGRAKYLEIRTIASSPTAPIGLTVSRTFCLHRLDLHPSLDELFNAFHDSCVRRKIRRAERESMTYEDGISEEILHNFYQLVVRTRRRQGLPPQPLHWFRNIITCLGSHAKIRLITRGGKPAAGIFTICHKSTMTYKYGCSDPRFHKAGAMQLLMWRAIQEAKENGILEFDMGRTDWCDEGLLGFKDRWSGARSTLSYLRHPAAAHPRRTGSIAMRIARRICTSVPAPVLRAAGSALYRHFA